MAAQFDLPPWIEQLTIEYAVKLLLFGLFGNTAPSGGGALTAELAAEATAANPAYTEGQNAPLSQDLGGNLRVKQLNTGVQELRTTSTSSGTTNVPAGAFSVSIFPLSGYVGTILGLAWVEANGSWNDSAQPGDTLPAYAITCSAGSYYLIIGKTP